MSRRRNESEEETTERLNQEIEDFVETRPLTEGRRRALELRFEWLKHLTTIIVATIVAIVTALRAFFPQYAGPDLTTLLFACFTCLGGALITAMIGMFAISDLIADDVWVEHRDHYFKFLTPSVLFVLGLLGFSVYATVYELFLF